MRKNNGLSRRSFLQQILRDGTALVAAAGIAAPRCYGEGASPSTPKFSRTASRVSDAKKVREAAANIALIHHVPDHQNNGEESDYPFVATYTKGMMHNELGEVDPVCWNHFVKAIQTGKFSDFELIPGGARLQKNPLSGLSFELEGSDPTLFITKAAPRIDRAENSAEMGELYWQALCRDIHFNEYNENKLINEAASDLSDFSEISVPSLNGTITPSCLFRGNNIGDLTGPYVSQFLLLDVPMSVPVSFGQNSIITMVQAYRPVQAGLDYITDYDNWFHCNNGGEIREAPKYQNEKRYICDGRDLANVVHIDLPWQFAINAAYILLNRKIAYDDGIPYKSSKKTEGFATFGFPHLMSLIGEASVRAARAAWFQKWWVHRRLRPETFSGRIHNHLFRRTNYVMIDQEILASRVLDRILESNEKQPLGRQRTYLLPQVYPEGCQLHPAYVSGHAAMIGAAVTVLKAWFDESTQITQPVTTNSDGTRLVSYRGEDSDSMTVRAELDKLASNIAIGRMWAGIHWRSDATQGLELGEIVATRLLNEQSITYSEPAYFTLTKFDGTKIRIGPA